MQQPTHCVLFKGGFRIVSQGEKEKEAIPRGVDKTSLLPQPFHTSTMPPSRWFKRSQEGLFGGKGRLTGHTISPSKRQYVLAVLEFDTLPLANHFYSPLLLAGASFIFTSAFFFL